MDDWTDDPPPPNGELPSAWHQQAIESARRAPGGAEAYAKVIEEMFAGPFEPAEVVEEARKLAAWLRRRAQSRRNASSS